MIIFLLVLGGKNKNPEVPEDLVLRNNQIGRIKSTLGERLNLFDFTDMLLDLLLPCLYSSITTV